MKASIALETLTIGLLLVSCARTIPIPNPTTANELLAHKNIGDEMAAYQVLGGEALKALIARGQVLTPDSALGNVLLTALSSGVTGGVAGGVAGSVKLPESNLYLGFPISLLGERQVFGGVITAVSDVANENLGGLKLTDLTPVHVRTAIHGAGNNQFVFNLIGCTENCSEASEESVLLSVPVVGLDSRQQTVVIDLGALGNDLNLIKTLDPDGSYTKLTTKSAKTVSIDYSISTLVFDVLVTMVPLNSSAVPVPETTFTVRWYLRLGSTFNPAFTVRGATAGVGFFMTERSATPVIERHALPLSGNELVRPVRVHYFIKNVPEEFRAPFKASFDEWNLHFKEALGSELLSYEFVGATDPRAKLLVAGDPRFNIVEWDLVNRAPYGGLGPVIANQFTGEILTSNILIQGPMILGIYSKWFKANESAQALADRGDTAGAERKLRNFARELNQAKASENAIRFDLTLGNHLKFNIRSQQPEVSDPIMQREDFEPIPAGYTFEKYMPGYFVDMLEHELGHNLGLRHNFRGSLKGSVVPTLGQVSVSCMDYLGRGFRYLDRVGPYDDRAISYGYVGKMPPDAMGFCTDDDVADKSHLTNSAECSRDDATPDPFQFFENRLTRAIGLLVARGEMTAPLWTIDDMKREIEVALNGMALYGATAESTGASWTNFFGISGRPDSPAKVKPYVVERLRAQVCDSTLADVVNSKIDEAAKAATQFNITALRQKAVELITPMNIWGSEGLGC